MLVSWSKEKAGGIVHVQTVLIDEVDEKFNFCLEKRLQKKKKKKKSTYVGIEFNDLESALKSARFPTVFLPLNMTK